jgi:hypothetical protein
MTFEIESHRAYLRAARRTHPPAASSGARRWDRGARGRRVLALAVVCGLAGAPAPGLAQDRGAEPSRPVPEVLEDMGKRLKDVLDLIIQAIPQYEMPEVLENGDILIRRKPAPPPRKPLPPGQDRT